jgi:predicted phage tail component-like protein
MDTLGDKTFEELNLKIHNDYQHPAAPDTRDYIVQIPGKAGAWDFGADMGVRPFSLPCTLIEKTPAARDKAIRDVTAHLFDSRGKPKTMKLIFEEEPEKWYMVRYFGNLPISRIIGIGQFTLPLTAFDPYAELIVENHEISWDSTELSYDSSVSMDHYSPGINISVTEPTTIDYYVDGYAIRPTIIIEGSASSLTVSANGRSFSLDAFTDQTYEIDGEDYTVIKGVDLNGFADFAGDFIELLPTDNTVTIDGSGIDITFSLIFRDQYL